MFHLLGQYFVGVTNISMIFFKKKSGFTLQSSVRSLRAQKKGGGGMQYYSAIG